MTIKLFATPTVFFITHTLRKEKDFYPKLDIQTKTLYKTDEHHNLSSELEFLLCEPQSVEYKDFISAANTVKNKIKHEEELFKRL